MGERHLMNLTDRMSALFCGLTTLDIICLVEHPPAADEKIVALDQLVVAGGPATNAAAAFSALGGTSILSSVIGRHALSAPIRDDLSKFGVEQVDLLPDHPGPPPISSVMVVNSTGERSVVSINAVKLQAGNCPGLHLLNQADLLLVDGHQMKASHELCSDARRKGIPVVMDGGSWKEGSEELLPLCDYVICSEVFMPPRCVTSREVVEYLKLRGVRHVAITRGQKPIICIDGDREISIDVAETRVIDTLGAGDILHGAFCHFLLTSGGGFAESLAEASGIASFSCRYFGTRAWTEKIDEIDQWPGSNRTGLQKGKKNITLRHEK